MSVAAEQVLYPQQTRARLAAPAGSPGAPGSHRVTLILMHDSLLSRVGSCGDRDLHTALLLHVAVNRGC